MSDLQLATGIAILISGYSQLRCGISTYHWLIIGRLAWFSSLTHLSCLTFLRNYLHNQKAQRQWRLALMLLLIIMLVTAMDPTGRYAWVFAMDWSAYPDNSSPQPNDYAICWFSTRHPAYPSEALVPMVVLVLLAGLGFIIRVIKLHKPLSDMMVKMREFTSQCLRRPLWVLYRWKARPRGLRRLTGNIIYYPALASFLSLRLIADHFSSMFFEVSFYVIASIHINIYQVYWLLAGFLIGLWSSLGALNVLYPDPDFMDLFEGASSNKWSFGQVMPIILLALPLVNILESFYPGK